MMCRLERPGHGSAATANDPVDASARRPLTGFRDILRRPKLRGALLTVFLTSLLCGPPIVFSPDLIRDALHGDVTGFSGAIGAFGFSGLLGAVVLLAVDAGTDRRRLSSWFAIGYGVIVMLAALTPWLWGLAALLVLAGLCLRGGVSVGSFVTGVTVGLIGVREALLLNGSLAVIGQLIVLLQGKRTAPGKPAT